MENNMPPKRIPKPVITRKDGQELKPSKPPVVRTRPPVPSPSPKPKPQPKPKNGNGNGDKNGNGRRLTALQWKFIEEYFSDLGGTWTEIAIRAGYAEKYACQQAKQNMEHPVIKQIIAERMKLIQEKVNVSSVQVINELAQVGLSDIRNIPGCPYLPDEIARAVSSFKMIPMMVGGACLLDGEGKPIYTMEFKLWPKTPALDSLAKHFGLYGADNKQKPAVQPQINVFVKGNSAIQVQIPDMAYEFEEDGQ